MKPLLFLLLLQLLRSTIESKSKLKLRMDIMAAATFVKGSNDVGLKTTLLTFLERFEFDQNHTRMALWVYDYVVVPITSLTDDNDTVVKKIKGINNRPDEYRSLLHKVLQEMLKISQNANRTDALKLFIVLTDKYPTKGDKVMLEYEEALAVAERIKAYGLFFIVFEYQKTLDKNVSNYLARLCDKENVFPVQQYGEVQKIINESILTKIIARACSYSEPVCYFVDTSLRICQGFWYYPTRYFSDKECRMVQTSKNPNDCNVTECYKHCDKYWPWQPETAACDCNVGNTRQGDLLLADLHNCPKVKECERCKSTAASIDAMEEKVLIGARNNILGLEIWAIVVIAAVGLAALGVMVFVVVTMSKRIADSTNSTFQSTVRTRVVKTKPPHYHTFGSSKRSKARGPARKKR